MSIDFFLEKHSSDLSTKKWGRVALLCNQSAYSFTKRDYLINILLRMDVLERVFLPEHGFFAELQDQIALDNAEKQYSNFFIKKSLPRFG